MAVFDLGDTPILTEVLEPNDANVSITIFDLTNNTTTALNSNSCSEVVASAAAYRYTVDFTNKPGTGDNYYAYYMKGTDEIPRWGEFSWNEDRARFDGLVHIDTTGGGTNSTDYPAGTIYQPVDNLADAITIADRINVESIHVTGDITLTSAVTERKLEAHGRRGQYNLYLNGQNMTGASFKNFHIQGTCTGGIYPDQCYITSITRAEGACNECVINGTIVVATNSTFYANNSANMTTTAWTISIPGTSTIVALRNFDGYFNISGLEGGEMAGTGRFFSVMLPDCTTGTVAFLGNGAVINLSGMSISNYMVPSCVWQYQHAAGDIAYTNSAADKMNFLHNIEGGGWHISGTAMEFTTSDNSTTVASFDLYLDNSLTTNEPDQRKRK